MANKITLVRIIFIPVLVFLLSREEPFTALLALLTFVLLAVTDLLDGYVARKRGEVTGTGKLLDPVADKLLVLAALLPLIHRHELPAWVGIVILGREFLISGLRMIATTERRIIAAGTWGKYKTTFYIIGLSIIIGLPFLPVLTGWLHLGAALQPVVERWLRVGGYLCLGIGVVCSLVSAWEYFLLYRPSSSASPPPAVPR